MRARLPEASAQLPRVAQAMAATVRLLRLPLPAPSWLWTMRGLGDLARETQRVDVRPGPGRREENGVSIQALFVSRFGPYFGLLGEENCWDEQRDARSFAGPGPVIAHPPCERWGRYWSGGPNVSKPKIMGDDGGCFESALSSVRKWGGVLEHPEGSHAFRCFGILRPKWRSGWELSRANEWTCCVAQGNYGHRSRKLTWLVFVGTNKPPELDWSIPHGMARLDAGYHSAGHRKRQEGVAATVTNRLTAAERIATPLPFAELLIRLACAA